MQTYFRNGIERMVETMVGRFGKGSLSPQNDLGQLHHPLTIQTNIIYLHCNEVLESSKMKNRLKARNYKRY